MVTEQGGGLEHKNSLGMGTRFLTRTDRAYKGWLGLIAHEYFHNWNVSLRPVELGPFDYENENYVKTLWVAEGFTDYYADILPKRAGLESREEFLDGISNQIEQVQTIPGRAVTPVNMASFDAWIKQYRPDENLANVSINYYPKGAVIRVPARREARRRRRALARYRHAVGDAALLGEKGYTPDQFYAVMSEAAGTDLKGWFEDRGIDRGARLHRGARILRAALPSGRHENARAYIGGGTRNDADAS